MTTTRPTVGLLALLACAAPAAAQPASPAPADAAARVDSIFARFAAPGSPGCTVEAAREGRTLVSRAYGLAELEHGAALSPASVIEAGSVSKQVTAAAAVLLALDGTISLDDDVRKWLPEVPDHGETITVRHLLHHTSGLRDWGDVVAVGGWPRGTRTYAAGHVLDVVGRQTALNYAPGTYMSYTNSGYTLLAILVERASGTPFAEFTRTRLFEPLGMESTGWRDDYARVVKGRATAYEPVRGGGFRMDMPFENTVGHAGLLTTAADLARWTENLGTGRVGGGEAFVREMHRPGRLTSGAELPYAAGLYLGEHHGTREVYHTGVTSGYTAFAARYPEQGLAVAVLCNARSANAPALGRRVSDLFLAAAGAGSSATPAAPAAAPVELPAEALQARAGVFRSERNGLPLALAVEGGRLRIVDGPPMVPVSDSRFVVGSAAAVEFEGPAAADGLRLIFAGTDTTPFVRERAWTPTAAQLAEFAGAYRSDEADATYTFTVKDGALVMQAEMGPPVPIQPAYPDAFSAGGGMFRFVRDAQGRVVAVSAVSDRVWDLRFARVE